MAHGAPSSGRVSERSVRASAVDIDFVRQSGLSRCFGAINRSALPILIKIPVPPTDIFSLNFVLA